MNRSMAALSAALLAHDGDPAAWTADIPERLEQFLPALPASARAALFSAAAAFDSWAFACTGRRLDALAPAHREAVLTQFARHPLAGRALDVLKVPVLLAAGTAWMQHSSPLRPTAPARPDPRVDCVEAVAWPARERADAIVIGSGAGGAVAARALALAGMRVVVVEEGRYHSTAELASRLPLDRLAELYRDGGATVAVGSPPILLPTGRAVGGTTLINAGTCYRTPPRVLRTWRKKHGLELADETGFGERLDQIERLLGVAPAPASVLGGNALTALRGAAELGWQALPLRRNAPDCKGSCQCVVGCPTGAKQSVQLSLLPEACAAGATILTSARVRRILVDPDRPGGARACGVVAVRPNGTEMEILAPLVVVAAGALQTPPLLRRSGLGKHPQLGRNLTIHPATSIAGRFPEPVTSWKGVLQSVGIEELHDDGILIEATAGPPGIGSFVLPGAGHELRAELEDSGRLAFLGAMVADLPSGRVLGARRSLVRYGLQPRDARRLLHAISAMGNLLFAAGAEEVLTGLPGAPRARSPRALEQILASTRPAQLHLSAFHPSGTVALGADPDKAPADPHGWLRGVRGVLVADAAALPSCPQVNPQLSIMALASATAEAAAHAQV